MKRIRATHPYAYRSGEWAENAMIVTARGQDCYLVSFPDGRTDLWPVEDPVAGYEFSEDKT